jgi:plasmid stabilization system protein ParE
VTVEVRLRPEAEEDLEEAATWYESQRPGLGQQFLDEVLSALANIAEIPLGYAVIYRNTRRVWMRRFPFGIFYQLDSDGAIVIAIIHGSRHPRRWQGRA